MNGKHNSIYVKKKINVNDSTKKSRQVFNFNITPYYISGYSQV